MRSHQQRAKTTFPFPPATTGAWRALSKAQREQWLIAARNRHFKWMKRRGGWTDAEPGAVFRIDGAAIVDLPALFCALGEAVNGPGGYFGLGLTALEDCLFGAFGVTLPFVLCIENSEACRRALDGSALASWARERRLSGDFLDDEGLQWLLSAERDGEDGTMTLLDIVIDTMAGHGVLVKQASRPPAGEDLAVRDPRGRTETEWLDVLELLLERLEAATRARIEVGPYWLDVGRGSASASLGARIRADGPLLGTASDCWEAAFCITGGEAGAHVDVMAFPFLRGSVVTRHGRISDLPGEQEVEEFWLQYVDGRWEDRGWHHPEGAGEWDDIRSPGDACFRALRCSTTRRTFAASEPLLVVVDLPSDKLSLEEGVSLSIHRLLRDGQEIVSAPPAVPLPRPDDRHKMVLAGTTPAPIQLESLSIPGGWVPGRYRVELRLHYARTPDSRDSDISGPFEFEVATP